MLIVAHTSVCTSSNDCALSRTWQKDIIDAFLEEVNRGDESPTEGMGVEE